MTLPIIHLSGSPHAQGLQHGRALREQVHHNLAVYLDRFAREGGLDAAEVSRRAERYLAAMRVLAPDYVAGMEGVAEGAELELTAVAALNVRYEILYHQYTQQALADGCTSFALLPEATESGHLLMGQNWDWIPETQGAVLVTVEPGELRTASFTEAGIVGGKIGLNSAGVGLAINGITSTSDDWARLRTPFHARCHAILRQRDFEAAVCVVTDEPRSCSQNIVIAQAPDRAADLEAAPDAVGRLGPTDGCLVHANHFEDPAALGIGEPPNEWRAGSCMRRDRLAALLDDGRPVSRTDLERFLRDHDGRPHSVCRHENPERPQERRVRTVTSVIMDLDARRMWFSDGPPCESPYEVVDLAGTRDGHG